MKVKKLLVAAMFVTISAAGVSAQDVQLATLQHGEDLQVFYGAGAFASALSAANDGDVITLSAGSFNTVHITKAVTIQGAGYVTDDAAGKFPTVIDGNIVIGDIENLIIEGIYTSSSIYFGTNNVSINATACTIKKSRFYNLYIGGYASNNSHTKDCLIDQCRITGVLQPDKESENLYIKNSIINSVSSNNSSATLFIENCVIFGLSTEVTAVFKNNIINYSIANASSSAYNNVFTSGNANNVINKSGNMASNANALFGYAFTNEDNKTYELLPDAQTTFLGTDGTQVGIYGGDTPFTNVPTNPQVTSKNIATKSTPDGKLNVSITVEAQNQ